MFKFTLLRFSGTGKYEKTTLENIAKVTGGKRMPKGSSLINEPNNHPYITVSNMNNNFEDLNTYQYVPTEIYSQIKNYIVDCDDLIISVAGTLGLVKKVPKCLDKANLTENANRISEIKIDIDYLQYYLNTKIIQNRILAVQTNNAQPKLALKEIRNFKINYPPIEEQKKVSKFLSLIDSKIQLLEKKHENYLNFKKYLMQQIFTQKLRFADCTDEWKVCKFKDLGTVKSGVGFSNKYQGHLDLDYNVYKVSDMNLKGNEKVMTKSNNTIDDSILNDMGAKLIREPSIIFAKVGEAIFLNRKRIAKPHFLIDNNMMAFSPNNNVDLEFMYYLTTSINFGKYAQIGALPSYNASDIYSIKCKIPPLEEQKRIGNLLSLADNKITNCSNQINNVLNFKRGLLQQMFV